MSKSGTFYETTLLQKLDYNQLCKLVHEGKTDEEIADMYFVHRSTIYRLRSKWGIKKPQNPKKYDWGIVKRMLECNLTYQDIAYVYGEGTTAKQICKYVSRQRQKEQTV